MFQAGGSSVQRAWGLQWDMGCITCCRYGSPVGPAGLALPMQWTQDSRKGCRGSQAGVSLLAVPYPGSLSRPWFPCLLSALVLIWPPVSWAGPGGLSGPSGGLTLRPARMVFFPASRGLSTKAACPMADHGITCAFQHLWAPGEAPAQGRPWFDLIPGDPLTARLTALHPLSRVGAQGPTGG